MSGSMIVVEQPVTQVVEIYAPGPRGPRGAGSGGVEAPLRLDTAGPVNYVGFTDRIVRVDYSTAPSTTMTAPILDIETDWPGRADLTYYP